VFIAAECPPGMATCDNGACIIDIFVCDGFDNCGDNSDEDPDLCGQ